MSLSEDEAGIYARNLVELQLERDCDAAVLRKAVADLIAKGNSISDAEVQNQMVVCFEEAKAQLAGYLRSNTHYQNRDEGVSNIRLKRLLRT
jgi:hypothetical protein